MKRETEIKHLGITLDQKLLRKTHFGNIFQKATMAPVACKSIAGQKRGCTQKMLRLMYTATVRPIITYGALIKLSTTARELNQLQRLLA